MTGTDTKEEAVASWEDLDVDAFLAEIDTEDEDEDEGEKAAAAAAEIAFAAEDSAVAAAAEDAAAAAAAQEEQWEQERQEWERKQLVERLTRQRQAANKRLQNLQRRRGRNDNWTVAARAFFDAITEYRTHVLKFGPDHGSTKHMEEHFNLLKAYQELERKYGACDGRTVAAKKEYDAAARIFTASQQKDAQERRDRNRPIYQPATSNGTWHPDN